MKKNYKGKLVKQEDLDKAQRICETIRDYVYPYYMYASNSPNKGLTAFSMENRNCCGERSVIIAKQNNRLYEYAELEVHEVPSEILTYYIAVEDGQLSYQHSNMTFAPTEFANMRKKLSEDFNKEKTVIEDNMFNIDVDNNNQEFDKDILKFGDHYLEKLEIKSSDMKCLTGTFRANYYGEPSTIEFKKADRHNDVCLGNYEVFAIQFEPDNNRWVYLEGHGDRYLNGVKQKNKNMQKLVNNNLGLDILSKLKNRFGKEKGMQSKYMQSIEKR